MAAREIERVFGGLSVRLWDDPIEWTLPETLRTGHEISTYLDDVEKAFEAGMNGITADTDLEKEIWTPAGVRKIRDVLDSALSRIDTLLSAANGESGRDTQVREQ